MSFEKDSAMFLFELSKFESKYGKQIDGMIQELYNELMKSEFELTEVEKSTQEYKFLRMGLLAMSAKYDDFTKGKNPKALSLDYVNQELGLDHNLMAMGKLTELGSEYMGLALDILKYGSKHFGSE